MRTVRFLTKCFSAPNHLTDGEHPKNALNNKKIFSVVYKYILSLYYNNRPCTSYQGFVRSYRLLRRYTIALFQYSFSVMLFSQPSERISHWLEQSAGHLDKVRAIGMYCAIIHGYLPTIGTVVPTVGTKSQRSVQGPSLWDGLLHRWYHPP